MSSRGVQEEFAKTFLFELTFWLTLLLKKIFFFSRKKPLKNGPSLIVPCTVGCPKTTNLRNMASFYKVIYEKNFHHLEEDFS